VKSLPANARLAGEFMEPGIVVNAGSIGSGATGVSPVGSPGRAGIGARSVRRLDDECSGVEGIRRARSV